MLQTLAMWFCLLGLLGLLGVVLRAPGYRAYTNRRRAVSEFFAAGTPPTSDNALGFFGVLLIIIVGNLIAWATGAWW